MTINSQILKNQYLAHRWAGFGKSIFTEMTQLAQHYKAVNLGQGFPDFNGPSYLLNSISEQVLTCHNQYSPSAGEFALRKQVDTFVSKSTGVFYSPEDEITITNGATEAIYCTINAFINPGDRVVVFEPAFDLYNQAIANAGGVVVPIRLHAPDTPIGILNNNQWTIDWSEFDAVAAGGFSALILNSPHNPTGKVFSEEELDRIASKILKNNAIVISDEVYENLIYDETPYNSLSSIPKIQHLVVRISSAAKTFGFTGLKVGWVCAPAHLTEAIRLVHQGTVFCVSPFTQLGLTKVMENENWFDEYLISQKKSYHLKRNKLSSILERAGYSVSQSQGTFFLMANFEKLAGDISDVIYARQLVETQLIATIPISTFYINPPKSLPWIRFAFCKSDEVFTQISNILLK